MSGRSLASGFHSLPAEAWRVHLVGDYAHYEQSACASSAKAEIGEADRALALKP